MPFIQNGVTLQPNDIPSLSPETVWNEFFGPGKFPLNKNIKCLVKYNIMCFYSPVELFG